MPKGFPSPPDAMEGGNDYLRLYIYVWRKRSSNMVISH